MLALPAPLRTACLLGAVLIGSLMPAAAMAQADPAPAPQPTRPEARPDALTPMRVILVEWKIKKGRENDFFEYGRPDRPSGPVRPHRGVPQPGGGAGTFPWIR